jgi:ABC-type nickel/cobalt efflux system permease component RcnA
MLQFITGISAAIAHVLSGPDHLAAVTPLAIESRRKSWGIGMAWGIGHTLGMLMIGLLFFFFRDFIPIDAISEHSEQLVGLLLIGIGGWAIAKVFVKKEVGKHSHPHFHKIENTGDYIHIHKHTHGEAHSHSEAGAHSHSHPKSHQQNIKAALGVGIFHGLAGVSHLIAVLPTLALPSKKDAALYLGGFGAGTIIAMVVFAAILGAISGKTSSSGRPKIYNMMRIAGGLVAIGIGIWWIVKAF